MATTKEFGNQFKQQTQSSVPQTVVSKEELRIPDKDLTNVETDQDSLLKRQREAMLVNQVKYGKRFNDEVPL